MLQSLGLLQACRKSSSTDRTVPLIGAPGGSRDVSSHNTLDWEHSETLDHHGSALESCDHIRGQASLDSLGEVHGDVVSPKRRDLGLQQLEPKLAKLGEDGALLVDALAKPT